MRKIVHLIFECMKPIKAKAKLLVMSQHLLTEKMLSEFTK